PLACVMQPKNQLQSQADGHLVKLDGLLVPMESLTGGDRCEMFSLMRRHYAGVGQAAFDADLSEKRWVIQVRHPATGRLCGFSTQMLLHVPVDRRVVNALFSGDTVIDRDHWGDQALARVWGRLALDIIDRSADGELYWFLISQGYKTYRYLPLFFHEFYPRYDAPTSEGAQRVLDALAQHKFADAYHRTAGVVRARADQYRLREGIAELTDQRRRDPHVRFFDQRNPGHAAGDELCCLAPLTRQNFTSAAYRVIGAEYAAASVP
ncbi:MAG: hypothetical protein ACREHD_11035, partial [Pirellulales bacterium]